MDGCGVMDGGGNGMLSVHLQIQENQYQGGMEHC